MRAHYRPHVLGVDDGPFVKGKHRTTPIVGVVMTGSDLIEGIAIREFPIDGEGITDFLARWIGGMRFHRALRAVMFSGVTIAGLSTIDVEALAAGIRIPVLVVNRRDPTRHRLRAAFAAAGLLDRLEIVEKTPEPFRATESLYAAIAGIDRESAVRIICATLSKSDMPEPIRVAHLIGRAIVTGESRGRV